MHVHMYIYKSLNSPKCKGLKESNPNIRGTNHNNTCIDCHLREDNCTGESLTHTNCDSYTVTLVTFEIPKVTFRVKSHKIFAFSYLLNTKTK